MDLADREITEVEQQIAKLKRRLVMRLVCAFQPPVCCQSVVVHRFSYLPDLSLRLSFFCLSLNLLSVFLSGLPIHLPVSLSNYQFGQLMILIFFHLLLTFQSQFLRYAIESYSFTKLVTCSQAQEEHELENEETALAEEAEEEREEEDKPVSVVETEKSSEKETEKKEELNIPYTESTRLLILKIYAENRVSPIHYDCTLLANIYVRCP